MLTSYVVASDEGPHRKYYGMTPVGRDSIAAQRDQWVAFCEVINTIIKTKEDN
jgi:PadR family transcriptional regulator PadR